MDKVLVMEMNKKVIVFWTVGALMLSACNGNRTQAVDDADADSTVVSDTVVTDSLDQMVAEVEMPKTADELFDDFFFNFAANRKLQRERTCFPLPVTRGQRTDSISKKNWKMEYFFMHQGYYTLIFNSRKQMENMKDTAVSHVVVEKIFLESNGVKEYVFDRRNGLWRMTAIRNTSIPKNSNSSFLTFYKKFAADPEFQSASIDETVKFTGPDPDDDFATMEGILTPDTWAAFAPELPHRLIYNIQYGEPGKAGNYRIFLIRGIANGLETELTFRRKNGEWKIESLTQ